MSPSTRKVWIEIALVNVGLYTIEVTFHTEGVD